MIKAKIKVTFTKLVLTPLKTQILQGATPKGLALTIACGAALSLFPLLGTTTALCLFFGVVFQLNQPILQAVNYLLFPVQLLTIPLFLRAGAWLVGAEPVRFNPGVIIEEFGQNVPLFLKNYGLAGLQAILAWAFIAPILIFVVYRVLRPVLEAYVNKWRRQ